MLSVVMLIVANKPLMLSVVMLSVIILSVVAPVRGPLQRFNSSANTDTFQVRFCRKLCTCKPTFRYHFPINFQLKIAGQSFM
jgi:hypothetical protein